MSRRMPPAVRATALIVLSSCSFGSLSTLTVLASRYGLPLVPTMMWRYLLASIVLLWIVRRTFRLLTRTRALRLLAVGAFGQAIVTYTSLRALEYLPVGALGFLFFTYPAWVTLIAAVTRREEITLVKLAAMMIAMAGISVMVGTPMSSDLHPTGVLIALGAAVLYAIYLPALHSAQEGLPPQLAAFLLITGVMLTFCVAAVAGYGLILPQTLSLWGILLALALVATVIAFLAFVSGLSVLGPVRTSIIATIEPFFTAVLGILLLGENFTLATVIGGALIVAAVAILQWQPPTRKHAAAASRSR